MSHWLDPGSHFPEANPILGTGFFFTINPNGSGTGSGFLRVPQDASGAFALVFQSYLVRIGVKGPTFTPPEVRPLGGPNTDPHKVFGGFWKTRVG